MPWLWDHPEGQFILMSLPSKAEVLPGAGKGHGAGMDGFVGRGVPGVPRAMRAFAGWPAQWQDPAQWQ